MKTYNVVFSMSFRVEAEDEREAEGMAMTDLIDEYWVNDELSEDARLFLTELGCNVEEA